MHEKLSVFCAVAIFDHVCKILFFFQATDILSKLYAEHQQGKKTTGFDVEVMTVFLRF